MSRTVWCASYPKSGNTWVRAIITSLYRGCDPDINLLEGGGVQNLAPLLTLGLPIGDLDDRDLACARRLAWAMEGSARSRPIPRKTHHAYLPAADGYPTDWQPEGARVIYVLRDPRDVTSSWAHHSGRTFADAADFLADEAACIGDGRSEGVARLASWSMHVRSWHDQRDMRMLTVTYEALSTQPHPTIMRLAEFLELEVTSARVHDVVRECSFERLAAAEIVSGFREQSAIGRAFFRQGRAGGWRRELPDEISERVRTQHADVMHQFGYR